MKRTEFDVAVRFDIHGKDETKQKLFGDRWHNQTFTLDQLVDHFKQGYAIAAALAELGAQVTLVSGPVVLPTPSGVTRINVETAVEMQAAVNAALPVDAAIMVAAVADWRFPAADQKIKKQDGEPPLLQPSENPDILAGLCQSPQRPRLVIGFAAETETVIDHATAKRARKGCDWIVANDVSPATGIMGGTENAVVKISDNAE